MNISSGLPLQPIFGLCHSLVLLLVCFFFTDVLHTVKNMVTCYESCFLEELLIRAISIFIPSAEFLRNNLTCRC